LLGQRHRGAASRWAKGQRRAANGWGSMANPKAARNRDFITKCSLRDLWGSLTLRPISLRETIYSHGLHPLRTGLQQQD
jgi:hypothetical protein